MSPYYFIECAIERGGFSSERTFEIDLGENGRLVGMANVEYFRDADKEPLDDETPQYGEKLMGYVACRKIRQTGDGQVLIEVPSSDMIHVQDEVLIPQ